MNRSLVGLLVDGEAAPAPGAEIRTGDTRVGAVTSATLSSQTGQAVALGYVKRDSAAPGTALSVSFPDGPRAAVVQPDARSGAGRPNR